MGNKKLIMMSSIPDSAIDEMDRRLTYLDQSFKLDEEFEQKLKNDEPLWDDMVKEHIKKSIERKKQLMQMYKVELIDMIFDLESRNETLVNNLLEVEKMYNDLKGEKKMDKKWYIFEGRAEGNRADMALLSDEEYEVIKRFFENKISFYDEDYAGTYDMLSCGPFDSKEEAVNGFIEDGIRTDRLGGTFRLRYPDDLVGEFKDMYKEENTLGIREALEYTRDKYSREYACNVIVKEEEE